MAYLWSYRVRKKDLVITLCTRIAWLSLKKNSELKKKLSKPLFSKRVLALGLRVRGRREPVLLHFASCKEPHLALGSPRRVVLK